MVSGKRRLEMLYPFSEYNDLIGRPAFDVVRARGKVPAVLGLETFPFVGECVTNVNEGGVEVRLRREAGGKEPFVPV